MSRKEENAGLPHDGDMPALPVHTVGGTVVDEDLKQPRAKIRMLIGVIVIGCLIIGLFMTPIGKRIVDRTNEFLTDAASQQPLKRKQQE